jgi:DNA-binding NarL/FixJ family response regulator
VTKKKVLIVEDERDIRELIHLYLDHHHYQVLVAENGQQALQLFKQENPDLILLDILLPGINGIEVCQEIRKHSDIPIIFLSCKSDSEDVIEGLEMGGDDYITKPFEFNILIARVKANLRRSAFKHGDEETNSRHVVQLKSKGKAQSFLAEPVTPRELEILSLIEGGFTNEEIARKLHISIGTVKGYNNAIFGKLNVRNRIQAITKARDLHLIQ